MFVRWGILVQYAVAVTVNLCSMASGVWLSWPSNVIKPLGSGELGYTATKSEIATMVALMDVGNILTPLPTSYLMDRLGRRLVVQSTASLFLAASLLAVMATSVEYLFAARVLAGMGKGVAYGVVPVFGAEIAELDVRGAIGAVPSIMVGLGTTFTFVLGPFLSYTSMNIANIILPTVLAISCLFVPESPYYLVMKDKLEQAKKSLKSYRQSQQINNEMLLIQKSVNEDMQKNKTFSELVKSKSNRKALIILIFMSIFQRTAGIGPLLAYSTSKFPENGGGASREVYCMIFSFILILAHNIGMPLVETLGRKKTTIISSLCVAAVMATFGVYYQVKNSGVDVSHYNWVPYSCLLLFGLSWGIGLCIIPIILIGELFPMNVKSYAGCVASIIYALANFATNKLFGEIPDGKEEVMFYGFCASSLLCCLFTVFFLVETKGKTFIEIQELLGETSENKHKNIK